MKKYILPIIAFMFFACDSNDDGFYNTKYIDTVESVVEIEVQPSYSVNDRIYVNVFIPNLLAEPGFSNPVDIRTTTGDATRFLFNYVLEMNNGGVWEFVDLTDLVTANPGSAISGSFVEASVIYDETAAAYLYRGGIQLQQAGEYRLSFGYNSTSADKVELISDSQNNNIILNLYSTTNNLDSAGYYNFVVN
jgi:hypothetical protein